MAASDIKLEIDSEQVRGLVGEAILSQLNEESKETILKEAVAYLVTPPPYSGYSSRQQPSPLQEAFNMAVNRVAHSVATELVENDPTFVDAVREKMKEAITTALAEQSRLRDALGSAVALVALGEQKY